MNIDPNIVTATGLGWSATDRDWTELVTYYARNHMEAVNWVRFNRDWLKDLRIDGVPA
jgi:hypothetical protein